MSKPVKKLMTDSIQRWCAGVDSACVVDISALDAITTNTLRGELKQKAIRVQVVKNSMARRALAGGPLQPLAEKLAGPCAIVFGDPAITDIAKELARLAKANPKIQLKQAIIEGEGDLLTVEELSRMKGRTELIGEIAMLISSPGRRIAGALRAPAARIAGCLKAMIEKKSE